MNKRILKSIFSGVLLGISWPETGGLFPLIFIALIPLLLVENEIFTKRYRPGKVYRNAYVTFFVFNLITTWWVWHASPAGAIMAVFFNSALMAVPFWLFHLTRKRIGNREGYVAFVCYWMAFEWFHFRWELSWPWLSYGNVFANQTNIIQWYEYTGVGGGTLWVLLLNLVCYFLVLEGIKKGKQISEKIEEFKNASKTGKFITSIKILIKFFFYRAAFLLKAFKTEFKVSIVGFILLIVPIIWSFIILSGVDTGKENETISIVLSQPNVDPYKKFDGGLSPNQQVKNFLAVTTPNLSKGKNLIIAPETAIPFALDENYLNYSDEVNIMKDFIASHPNTSILTGLSSRSFFKERQSKASKKTTDGNAWYENYNSALLLDNQFNQQIYHKSELVLGVERLPFSFIMKYVEDAFDLGGTTGTLGTEKEAKVFNYGNAKIAPTICYESIYGDYTGDFSAKGANIIAIMTNDAWWYDTPGYKQLLAYAKLRAIENRKWIARSANTGISCFINPIGQIIKKTNWEETTSLQMDVPLMNENTYYTNKGDYLGRLAGFMGGLMLLLTFGKKLRGKKTLN